MVNHSACPLPTFVNNFAAPEQNGYANLCWAAVALSVDQLLDPTSNWKTLCDVVSDPKVGGPAAPNCDVEGDLITALTAHTLESQHPEPEDGPYSSGQLNTIKQDFCWKVIKCEIADGRVVCAGINFGDQYKHYVAIYGFEECGTTRTVYVLDPEYQSSHLVYEQFVSRYRGSGTWVEMDRIRGDSPCR